MALFGTATAGANDYVGQTYADASEAMDEEGLDVAVLFRTFPLHCDDSLEAEYANDLCRRIQSDQSGSRVGRGSRVRHVAADGGAVSDLNGADFRCALSQEWKFLCDQRRYLDLTHGRECADGYAAIAVFADAGKTWHPFEIDEIFRQQAFLLQRDDQIGAAGEKSPSWTVFLKQPARFLEGCRLIKIERLGAFHENSAEC